MQEKSMPIITIIIISWEEIQNVFITFKRSTVGRGLIKTLAELPGEIVLLTKSIK